MHWFRRPRRFSLRSLLVATTCIACALAIHCSASRSIGYVESISGQVLYDWQAPRIKDQAVFYSWMGSPTSISVLDWNSSAEPPNQNPFSFLFDRNRRESVHTIIFDGSSIDEVDSSTLSEFPRLKNVIFRGLYDQSEVQPAIEAGWSGDQWKGHVQQRKERLTYLKDKLEGNVNVTCAVRVENATEQ